MRTARDVYAMHIEVAVEVISTCTGKQHMRILIADDSTEITMRLRRLLLDMPFVSSVDVASTIETAVVSLRSLELDLLILDHHFPEGRGIEVLDAFIHNACQTRVILFTAYVSTLGMAAYAQHHVDAILDKSRDLETLLELVSCMYNEKLLTASEAQRGGVE